MQQLGGVVGKSRQLLLVHRVHAHNLLRILARAGMKRSSQSDRDFWRCIFKGSTAALPRTPILRPQIYVQLVYKVPIQHAAPGLRWPWRKASDLRIGHQFLAQTGDAPLLLLS